jgi:chemotaxis protein methyltransferase CheR
MELTPFVNIINKNCGLLVESAHSPNLSDAIHKRMAAKHLGNSKQYFDCLLNSPKEIQNLTDLLTNNETYFFRERPHFQICIDHLIPSILKKKKAIKIISAGCSTGEEPYSLAIALADRYGLDVFDTVSIFGFDISKTVLSAAKNGEFGAHSFRESDTTYREKYFQKTAQGNYKLNPSIKGAVQFFHCNLSHPPFPEEVNSVDIIFYRNVSIYFSQQTKKQVLKNLSEALNDNGHLILSSTETFSHGQEGLVLEEIGDRFFYVKKNGAEQIPLKILPQIKPKEAMKPATPVNRQTQVTPKPFSDRDKSPSSLFDQGLEYAIKKDYEKSFSCLETLLALEPTHIEAQNLCATIHINLQQLEKAKERCQNVVTQDEWNLEARLLSGIVARMEDNYKDAVKWFKSVSFIQPSCWTAHMYLAELHNIEEDIEGAYREYSLALKHIVKTGVEKRNLSYFPLACSQEQLVHLFEHNLKNLKQRINKV